MVSPGVMHGGGRGACESFTMKKWTQKQEVEWERSHHHHGGQAWVDKTTRGTPCACSSETLSQDSGAWPCGCSGVWGGSLLATLLSSISNGHRENLSTNRDPAQAMQRDSVWPCLGSCPQPLQPPVYTDKCLHWQVEVSRPWQLQRRDSPWTGVSGLSLLWLLVSIG